MTRQSHSLAEYLPKTLLLGVYTPYNRNINMDSYFEEFRNLAKTHGLVIHDELFIKIRSIDPTYFFTEGKMQEIKEYCDKNDINEVVVSEAITPLQERSLRDILHCRVFDRTQLILEIFEKAAHSAEGKAQVAIAMLRHQKTRLTGKGLYLAQQSGGIGLRGGPGETAKEKEKRHIESTLLKLTKQLAALQATRTTQRKSRSESGIKQACIIGYTNAGKSTILNALTKSKVLAQDKLFCTLDTTTRELYIDATHKLLLSDTVGFIQQLPHQLIEAFKSTLSELIYADLLIQVVDIADENWEQHINVVNTIVQELGAHEKPMLYVFNKADLIPGLSENQLIDSTMSQSRIGMYQPHVVISALSKESIAPLTQFLHEWALA